MLQMTTFGGLGDTAPNTDDTVENYNMCRVDHAGEDSDLCATLYPKGAAQQAQRTDPWAPQVLGPLVEAAGDAAQWAEQKLGPLVPASGGARRPSTPSASPGKTIAFVLAGIGLAGLLAFGVHRHRQRAAAT